MSMSLSLLYINFYIYSIFNEKQTSIQMWSSLHTGDILLMRV